MSDAVRHLLDRMNSEWRQSTAPINESRHFLVKLWPLFYFYWQILHTILLSAPLYQTRPAAHPGQRADRKHGPECEEVRLHGNVPLVPVQGHWEGHPGEFALHTDSAFNSFPPCLSDRYVKSQQLCQRLLNILQRAVERITCFVGCDS